MLRTQSEIYERLESAFEKLDIPMTCVDLMDIPEIREAAVARWGKDIQDATERLSDTLGFMWRKGLIERYSVDVKPPGRSRFAYGRKHLELDEKPVPHKIVTKNKANLVITEKDGEVVLQFDKFTVVIKPN